MDIPDGALPAGTAPESVTVQPYSVPSRFADAGMLAAYNLGPDGLLFAQPVTLTVATSVADGLLPHVVLVSKDKAELLSATYELDPVSGQVLITAQIAHFSTVVLETGNIKAEISNPGDHPVNAPFDVQVTITRVTENRVAPLDETQGSVLDQSISKVLNAIVSTETFGPITVTGAGHFQGSRSISPGYVAAPGSSLTVDAEPLNFSSRFTCLDSSRDERVSYWGEVQQQGKATSFFFISGNGGPQSVFVQVVTRPFQCTAALPTVSVKPSITPSPTPTPTKSPTPTPARTPQVVTSLPEGHISGMCFQLNNGNSPSLVFTLYWYGFPIKSMTITFEGANLGVPTELPFDSAGPGFENAPFSVDGAGPVKIKQVLVTKPDGTQVDITKPFTDFLKTDTLDISKKDNWGTIC